jgi:DNA-binding NarL/FixJ family response regulator
MPNPCVILCEHQHPVLHEALILLLKTGQRPLDVISCSGQANFGSERLTDAIDLVIRLGLSTHSPLSTLSCIKNTEAPVLLIAQGWLESQEAVGAANLRGYLGPGCEARHLFTGIGTLLNGGSYYHSGSTGERTIGLLTKRQKEVLELLSESMMDAEIASKLAISENTVRNHIKTLGGKLGVERRGDLLAYAIKGGLKLNEDSVTITSRPLPSKNQR